MCVADSQVRPIAVNINFVVKAAAFIRGMYGLDGLAFLHVVHFVSTAGAGCWKYRRLCIGILEVLGNQHPMVCLNHHPTIPTSDHGINGVCDLIYVLRHVCCGFMFCR
jgi:hypothetical protein